MEREVDLRFVQEELRFLGIHQFPKNGMRDLIAGKDRVQLAGSMQLSQYGNQENMNYTIFMKRNQHTNQYQPFFYQAALQSDPLKAKGFQVRDDAFFTMQDAFNLLNGRSVQKLTIDWRTHKMQNAWFQLDFNARDVDNNPKVERINARSDLLMIDALKRYPIKQLDVPAQRVNLILSLFKGNAEPVDILRQGNTVQAYAQAQPKDGTVVIFERLDAKLLKIQLGEQTNARPDNDQEQSKRKTISHGKSL